MYVWLVKGIFVCIIIESIEMFYKPEANSIMCKFDQIFTLMFNLKA